MSIKTDQSKNLAKAKNIALNSIDKKSLTDKTDSFLTIMLSNLDKTDDKIQYKKTDSTQVDESFFEKKEILLDDLLKIASLIKSEKNITNFPTQNEKLISILQKEDVISQIKEAKNIDELIKIAKKNKITVKKFEFTENIEKNEKLPQIFQKTDSSLKNKNQDFLQTTDSKILKEIFSKKTKQKSNQLEQKKGKSVLETFILKNSDIKNIQTPLSLKDLLTGTKEQNSSSETSLLQTALETEENSKEIQETKDDKNFLKISPKEELKTKTEQLAQKISHSRIKETLNNFANELREKIENYKPPLMKIQMTLKPQNLGEVGVTLLNRGNTLHVNINSNANAISIFTQNQAEFKNSLVNMGFTNLQMNFGTNSQSGNQEQQRQKFSNDKILSESNENEFETIQNIELVIPRYI